MVDSTIPALVEQLTPELAARSLVVEDVAIVPAGSRRLLRVLVERSLADLDPGDSTTPVPPLSLDEIADATRVVGDALDRTDLMGQRPYTLEVSSPGVGRPLTGYDGLRRNVGRLVDLRRGTGQALTGRVVAVSPDEVRLDVRANGSGATQEVSVPLPEVESARVQVEFNRKASPDGADAPEEDD